MTLQSTEKKHIQIILALSVKESKISKDDIYNSVRMMVKIFANDIENVYDIAFINSNVDNLNYVDAKILSDVSLSIKDIFSDQSAADTLVRIKELIAAQDTVQSHKENPIIIVVSDDFSSREIKTASDNFTSNNFCKECRRIFVGLGETSNFDIWEKFTSRDKDFFIVANVSESFNIFYDLTNQIITVNKGNLIISNKHPMGLSSGIAVASSPIGAVAGLVGPAIIVGGAVAGGSGFGFPIPTRLSRILKFFRGDKEDTSESSENDNKVTNIKNVREIQFAAIAPENFAKGESSMIDILMYEEEYKYILEDIRQEYETKVKERKYGYQKIEDDTIVRVELNSNSPQIALENPEITQKWIGKYLRFSFLIRLPQDYKEKQISFESKVYFNDVLATTINFIALCKSNKKQKIKALRKDIESAFISYASKDLDRVLYVVQGIQKVRPDLDIFIDKENLRSGTIWEQELKQEIESRDIFYLFWSRSAKASEWVEKEWRYALLKKGLRYIEPVPIEPPTVCPPPKELESIHFNERLLYLRK